MKKDIIVITGGPGTGKSTLITALSDNGYVCYPEISREVTLSAQKQGIDQLFLKEPLLFSQLLLEGRLQQYQQAYQEQSNLLFLDRGLPDVLAYINYIGGTYPDYFNQAVATNRYTKVFILPPWQEIYTTDQARYETFEQAQKIHQHLIQTYTNHGYLLTQVPVGTIHDRIDFILKHTK